MDIEVLKRHLEWAEGRRSKAYLDNATPPRITVGIGRNLTDKGLSDAEIDFLLENDIADVLAECAGLPYWFLLDDVRQLVVADLVFNMGLGGWRKFVKANEALGSEDYERAADELKDSAWYTQTGRRARKLVEAMRTGVWTP